MSDVSTCSLPKSTSDGNGKSAIGGRFWQLRVAIGGNFWRGAGLLPVYVRGHCGLYRLQERAISW